MTNLVNEELKHIPRTGRHNYDAKAEFRMLFNGVRRRDLKVGRTKQESLVHCIEFVRKSHPSWQPVFDKTFFRLQ